METFVIEGGKPLSGTIKAGGNKNAALPLLAASLLFKTRVKFTNLPRIRDVETMVALLKDLGAEVRWDDRNSLTVNAESVTAGVLNPDLCQKIRASILLAGPLLARFGKVTLPPPGGDVIGRRRIDTHLHVLAALGAEVTIDKGYELTTGNGRLTGCEIVLDEPSVTASENAIMAASVAKGRTILHNVASEPHVCELADFLNKGGANITGMGSNTLVIDGVEELSSVDHEVCPDYIEIGSYIGLAAVTGSTLTIEGVRHEDLRMVKVAYERLGVRYEALGNTIVVPAEQEMKIMMDCHGAVPKIDDGPWPAFPSDLMSIMLVVATQCEGTILFFEKMFESRLFFVDRLNSMGARIVLCDPHRAIVIGKAPLIGATLDSPDIRAGMALLLAGLCASGTTKIGNIGQIDRGYEEIDKKFQSLGASIMRVPS
jgi:UDP-N-acetylglucosamine 1-carboxyvinyltransferase